MSRFSSFEIRLSQHTNKNCKEYVLPMQSNESFSCVDAELYQFIIKIYALGIGVVAYGFFY